MKSLFLIIICLLAFACAETKTEKKFVPKSGETIILKSNFNYVLATRDKDFLPKMNSVFRSNDKELFASMIKSEKAIAIENGTKAMVIESGFATQVRVLENAYENELVWTNVDYIQPLPDK